MKSRGYLLALIVLPSYVFGTDLTPWLTRHYEIQASATELLQYYQTIQSPHKHIRNHTLDSFTTFGLELSAYDYSTELETTVAHTHRQKAGCDNVRLTGRYRFMNDILGDVVSATAGVTVTQAFRNSLRDPSSFHHGIIEAEAHLSIGRETSCRSLWISRWWGLIGLGCGDYGSPWLHGHFEWEKNWYNQQHWSLFADTLWGIGGNSFALPFRGYGSVRHQSLDIGSRYRYIFENGFRISLEYAFRVYALNFPQNTNRLTIELLYPFGL